MKQTLGTAIGLFFFVIALRLRNTGGLPEFQQSILLDYLEEQLHRYAEASGLEKEFNTFKEGIDKVSLEERQSFAALLDPKNLGPHKPDIDSFKNVTELITSKEYGCEEHHVVTPDGYVLALQRIVLKRNKKKKSSTVVLLQHGLLDSAATWVINQKYNSLGFMLADEGFDVWLSNSRGNEYSHTNVHLKSDRKEFWQFSWDEMAKFDLPSFVDYITFQTGVDKIYYVGHSQGTLMGFTGFSQNKTLANKIKHFFAMAPITTIGHVEGPMKLLGRSHDIFYNLLNTIGYEEVLPITQPGQTLSRAECSFSPITCGAVTFFLAGPDWAGYNKTRSDVYYTHFPAGTSLMNINHWGQMITSGLTQKYDYGSGGNKKKYGQETPPIYNVTGLSVPVSLFYGGNDLLADVRDVVILRQNLTDAIVYDLYLDEFNHLDFVWGTTAYKQVYDVIIKQIHNGVSKRRR